MTRYRYCMHTAQDMGEGRHPETVILEFFPGATDLEPVSVADCWLFESGDIRAKKPMPEYFVDISDVRAMNATWGEVLAAAGIAPPEMSKLVPVEYSDIRMLVPDPESIDGLREETDDELRARLKAKHG